LGRTAHDIYPAGKISVKLYTVYHYRKKNYGPAEFGIAVKYGIHQHSQAVSHNNLLEIAPHNQLNAELKVSGRKAHGAV
jgi:hypothetical protein